MMTWGALTWAADSFRWVSPCLLGLAGLTLLCRGRLPSAVVWTGLVLPISAIAGMGIDRLWSTGSGVGPELARACAALALIWSVCAAAAQAGRGRAGPADVKHFTFGGATRVVALLLAIVAMVIQSVVLMMRAVFVALELVRFGPHRDSEAYGFGADGLWTLGFVFAACSVSLFSTRDRRLVTCQFWCAIMMASWACLLVPPVRVTAAGGLERTACTLALLAALAILLALVAIAIGWLEHGEHRRVAWPGPSDLAIGARPWPGLGSSVAVIATAVVLLVCYHLAVPVAVGRGGFRLTAFVATGSAALAGLACFSLVGRMWSVSLADAAMALASVSLCSLATAAVPAEPASLAERYPLIFNAMIVGLAVATGGCTWLASIWQQQREVGRGRITAGRLIPHAKRFAFLNAALALVVSAAMALWPRQRAIAAMDHIYIRVVVGFSANLFLLLVMLWCSRRLRRPTFHILTLLVLASTVAFLIVRIVPFTAQFG